MIYSNQYHFEKELKKLRLLVQLYEYYRKGSEEKNDQCLQRHFYKYMYQMVCQQNYDVFYDDVAYSNQLLTEIDVEGKLDRGFQR